MLQIFQSFAVEIHNSVFISDEYQFFSPFVIFIIHSLYNLVL